MDVSLVDLVTVYPKKYAHGFCFAVLCCGYTLTDFPISIRLTSLALWQSNDCPSASKATLMNMDKYFMWIHYERLHNHNKAKHNKTVCIFLEIYCIHTFGDLLPSIVWTFRRLIWLLNDKFYWNSSGFSHWNWDCVLSVPLTHWGRDKMVAIFETTFSNAFSWMKMHAFRLRLRSLFRRVQLVIFQHWFR